jgi:hypothetical protein
MVDARDDARPRVLQFGVQLDLAAVDLAMPENKLLRQYVLKRLVVPVDEDSGPDDMFAPAVNMGLQGTHLLDENLRPLAGDEHRRRLIAGGRRAKDIWNDLEKYVAKLLDVLGRIADPNGISAATYDEAERLLGHELSPKEIRQVASELVRRGLAGRQSPPEGDVLAVMLQAKEGEDYAKRMTRATAP